MKLPLNQIILGDCVEILSTFPEDSIDLIFADPPYNLQLQQELWRPNQTRVNGVEEDWDKFDSFNSYDKFTEEWLLQCRRVLKSDGTLWVIGSYHNIYRIGSVLQDLDFWILNDIVWVKTNPMPNFRGVRFTNATEILLWVQKHQGAPYTFNYRAMKALNEEKQMRSDWLLSVCSGKERIKYNGEKVHPTQKPEALLYRVIMSTSNPGDIILDPFFGTGTTGAVAKRLHRHWIGIEKEKKYVEVAWNRIQEVRQMEFIQDVFVSPEPRRLPRVPFGMLLEYELLEPGQLLYFGKSGSETAIVSSDGTLQYNGTRGSIHQVGKQITKAPCNGWKHWFYDDSEKGERRPIEDLRQFLRNQAQNEVIE